jgi:hypothetical protein
MGLVDRDLVVEEEEQLKHEIIIEMFFFTGRKTNYKL